MSQFAIYFGVFAIILAAIRLLASLNNPGKTLHKKIFSLGKMSGLTANQISQVAGPHSQINFMPDGSYTCTWAAGYYSITLLFNKEGKCESLVSEKTDGKTVQLQAQENPDSPPAAPKQENPVNVLLFLLCAVVLIVVVAYLLK